jgi:acyl carrier protein
MGLKRQPLGKLYDAERYGTLFDRPRIEQMTQRFRRLLCASVFHARSATPASPVPASQSLHWAISSRGTVMKDHLEEEQELLHRLLEQEGLASATAVMAEPEERVLRPGMDADSYEAPRTALERHLAAIWAEVLEVPRIGIHDDFFAFGGGSLCGAVMAARVEDTLAIELPVRELFDSSTVAELAAVIEQKLDGKEVRIQLPEAIAPEVVTRETDSRTHLFPLSYAQEQLWFLDRLQPGSDFYNVALAWRIKGDVDIPLLESSLKEVVRRHEALRTCFVVAGNGMPKQKVVSDAVQLPLVRFDLTGIEAAEKERHAKRILAEEGAKPFVLSQMPLWRGALLRMQQNDLILGLTLHHIVCDDWSFGVLWKELSNLYQAFENGGPSPLPDLGMQYKDYALKQREWMRSAKFREQMEYWKRQLKGMPEVLSLPTDHPRPETQRFRGRIELRDMRIGLLESLNALSRQEKGSLFITLMAACQVLLLRYSGQEDFAVGTVIANRNRRETQNLIGFFLSTLVIRANLQGQPTFREVLRRTREATLGAFANQEVPFEKLVEELAPNRDVSRAPLFQVAFTLVSTPPARLELGRAESSEVTVDMDTSKFDLAMVVDEGKHSATVALNYNTDLFEAETIRRMLAYYEHLLEGIVADPDQPVWTLPMESALDQDLPGKPSEPAAVKVLHEVGEERVNSLLVLPRTELEQTIAAVWRTVLGRDQVGVHDNFFDLGGYSLLAVQLLLRLRTELSLELELVHLFQFPTISTLVRFLQTGYNFEIKFRGTRERAGKQRNAVQKFRRCIHHG